MELVYTVTKPQRYSRHDLTFREDVSLVAVSPRNALAICTTADLDGLESASTDRCMVEAVYKIYICDINKPWTIHRLMTCSERIVCLEWHHSGTRLLVATALGICYIYHMKDHMLNSWHSPQVTDMKGEEIVVACWLNPGAQMALCTDRKDSVLYSEKLLKSRSQPSLSRFGGKPVDGVLAITSTGMVAVIVCKQGDTTSDLSVHLTSLSTSRCRVSVADVAFSSTGDILVATNNGTVTSAIQCHHISLQDNKNPSEALSIICSPATGFYAKCHLDKDNAASLFTTHVRYMERESAGEMVIVAAGDGRQSFVELWALTNQTISLHRMYRPQGSDSSGVTGHCIQKWVHQSTISYSSLPMSIAVPRFPVVLADSSWPLDGTPGSVGSSSSTDSTTSLFQYIAIAYRDGSIKLVHRRTFQPMTTTNLDTGITDLKSNGLDLEEEMCGEKRRKTVAHMTHMQQSFTGCVLVGIDQYSCVYVMKAVNTRDPVTQVPNVYLVAMFEYLLVAGLDCWDCLTAVKPGMVESVLGKLSDNFSKQPACTQELLYTRLLTQKISLYRLSATSTGQLRAADSHCRILLHCISNYFKSLLRPKVLSASEVSPAERLTMSCNMNADIDIDAIMMSLKPEKNFVVEALSLQSMQPLIQWVADLALHLIGIVSTLIGGSGGSGLSGAGNYPGVSLLRDSSCLFTLRELLVVIKTWGLISTSCQPRFSGTAQNVDYLPVIFRCITKIWQAANGGGPSIGRAPREFDEGLIDECCIFLGQIHLPPIDEGLFGCLDYSQQLFSQNFPLKYVFGERPMHSYRSVTNGDQNNRTDIALLPGQSMSNHLKDVVRLIGLGAMPYQYETSLVTANPREGSELLRPGSEPKEEVLRVCLRCGCRSLANRIARLPAAKIWELRFERACVCGGPWKLEHAFTVT